MFKLLKLLSIISLLVSSIASSAVLKKGLGLYISKSGQEMIGTNVGKILELNGISSNFLYLEKVEHKFDPQTSAQLMSSTPEAEQTYEEVLGIFTKIFSNLELKPHQFNLNLDGTALIFNWTNFAIKSNRMFSSELNKDEISLVFEAEASSFALHQEKIRFNDSNNKFLGTYGIDGLELSSSNVVPLRISIPFKINKKGKGLVFKIEEPNFNFDELVLEMKHDSPLVMPKIKISIDDFESELDIAELEKVLEERKKKILSSLQVKLQDFSQTNLSAMVEEKVNKFFDEAVVDSNFIAPPGAPSLDVQNFVWDILLRDLRYVGDSVYIELDADIKDPLNKKAKPLSPSLYGRNLPERKNITNFDTDFAISINKGILNKAIQLSAARGYFDYIELDDGEKVKFAKTPEIHFQKTFGGRTGGRIKVKIDYSVTGLQKIVIKNPLTIEFDLLIHFPLLANGSVGMSAYGIDYDSVKVDKNDVRFFYKKVIQTVKETLREKEQGILSSPLSDGIPIPNELMGVPLTKEKILVDKNGYLLIYLNTDYKRLSP